MTNPQPKPTNLHKTRAKRKAVANPSSVNIKGQLQIDVHRGVIYFHPEEGELQGVSLLRISGLPTPIPTRRLLDIGIQRGQPGEVFHHEVSTSW